MELIYEAAEGSRARRRVYLICVFRNEGALLDYFMEYYRSLGITHFLMIDNDSDDDGPGKLRALRGLNLSLYRTSQSYREADFGVQWVNDILQARCRGEFCLVVDTDELFAFDDRRYASLEHLIKDMEASDANVLQANMIDMYPAKLGEPYESGTNFLAHSPYFDAWNSRYYSRHHRIYGKATHKVGGMRQRVFGARVCIHKFPFFKYDFFPLGVAAGIHYLQFNGKRLHAAENIRLFSAEALLLHFKFLRPDFRAFVESRIRNNEDWNDSEEYRAYLNLLNGREALSLYDPEYSRRFTSLDDLDSFWQNSAA